jgi:hypothetical protein
MRLAEAEIVGYGFQIPVRVWQRNCSIAPIAPRFETEVFQEVAVSG